MNMIVSDKKMHELGHRVLTDKGVDSYRSKFPAQQREFVGLCDEAPRPRFTARHFAFGSALAVAGAVAIALLLFNPFQRSPIPFWIGADKTVGVEGSWVETSNEDETTIRFKGGSRFLLRQGAARVVEASNEKVVVDLSKGKLNCNVSGNGATRWIIRAGLYQVTVTGTEFVVHWAPQLSRLKVLVTEGSVLVSGAKLKNHGIALSAGDDVEINDGAIFIENKNSKAKSPATNSAISVSRPANMDETPYTEKTEENNSGQKTVRPNKQSKRVPKVPEWKQRYAQKDYAGVVSAAQQQGIDRLALSLGADELWQLSKAARITRNGVVARKFLVALTNRFSGTAKAHNAIFLLGRVSQELLKDSSGAKRWYEQYLALGLGSALSEEALGRLIGVCHHSGFPTKAKRYAHTYLAKYPSGLFAERAQSVLKSNI